MTGQESGEGTRDPPKRGEEDSGWLRRVVLDLREKPPVFRFHDS